MSQIIFAPVWLRWDAGIFEINENVNNVTFRRKFVFLLCIISFRLVLAPGNMWTANNVADLGIQR